MENPRRRTLVYLLKENKILLAYKKTGLGKGNWNGPGGKCKSGENYLQAAIRETKEEIMVTPLSLEKVAILNFSFPQKPEYCHKVCVFLTKDWSGKPSETEEMKPKWFNISKIPYEKMWPDDIHWLPIVLSGKKLKAKFEFDNEESLLSFSVKIIS